MIQFQILPSSKERVKLYLEKSGSGILRGMAVAMQDQMRQLSNYVTGSKLSGQVLNVRTGNLRSSVNAFVSESPDSIEGKVAAGNLAPYAAIHEYGFSGAENVRESVRTSRKGTPYTVRAFTRQMNMPERSFLRTSLAEKKAEILEALAVSVGTAIESAT